jgi:predicted esterase
VTHLLTLFVLALAQPETPATPPLPQPQADPASTPDQLREEPATRLDLALAYLRFERALRAANPDTAALAVLNKKFDDASLSFFTGRYNSAIRTLTELTRTLDTKDPAVTPARRVADALRLVPSAAVLHEGNKDSATLAIEPLFDSGLTPSTPAPALDLVLLTDADAEAWRGPLPLAFSDDQTALNPVPLAPLFASFPKGDFTLALAARKADPAAFLVPKGRLTIRAASVEPVREVLTTRLDAITPTTPDMTRAHATAKARLALLSDERTTRTSARFLSGMDALAAELAKETADLEAGRNPYANRPGDHWRIVANGKASIPCRVYAPATLKPDAKAPLLIAYHGAGGDESMFFEGYGGGLLKDLADQHALLVACPLTYTGSNNAAFDRIIEDLAADYHVDRSRIYVLGHSMGAGAASALASARVTTIAAVSCIAGGGFTAPREGTRRAPIRLTAAEIDPLFSIARARKAGATIAAPDLFVEAKAWGHTLIVGHDLPDAVEWLLTHRLQSVDDAADAKK